MISNIIWLIAIGPVGLILSGMLFPMLFSQRQGLAHSLVRTWAAVCILISLGSFFWVMFNSPLQTPLLGFHGLGLSLYLDKISASLFSLVSFIGLVVLIYSRHYLAGDVGHSRFMKWTALTLGSVLVLIISGNLVLFYVAWVTTSIYLHQLLTFYSERPSAILAARKKRVVSRISDALILISMLVLYRQFGSLEYTAILEGAQAAGATGLLQSSLSLVAVLFALAGLVQSAQFPLHGWLLEVMETPTPVSALLHAGVINAGGFLLIRYSHLITLSPSAMNLLIAVGALTALFGSLVMMTQTSVKVSLAYSTIAQMGFMMLECGFGVFSAALLHIIAHSAYKAHAFLSSGETVRLAQPAKSLQPSPQGSAYGIVFATFISLLTVTLLGIYSGSNLLTQPGPSTLSYIFALGIAIFLSHGFKGRVTLTFIFRIFVSVFGITILFFATQRLATLAFYDSLPSTSQPLSTVDLLFRILLILFFSTLTMIPQIAPLNQNPRWLAFYIHLSHGFYINTFANRLAILFWPGAAPQAGPPTYIPTYNHGGEA